ncbi:hypothetical protein QN277_003315 [Acacia crassicarpa]|uniref:Uncharacterized protein n=1 Tax=Acacia crassicarpa TaxID=499986 RepID=A0AAE1JZ22_9FABA|nr:hypothetical protein QN277_003315 [Acacia crassicarpa]
MQRKIKHQYDELVKCHKSKKLSLPQVHEQEGCNIRRSNNNKIYTKGHKVLSFTEEFFKQHMQSQKVLSIIEESQK